MWQIRDLESLFLNFVAKVGLDDKGDCMSSSITLASDHHYQLFAKANNIQCRGASTIADIIRTCLKNWDYSRIETVYFDASQ